MHHIEEQHIGYLLRQTARLSHTIYNKKLEKEGISVSQDSVLSLLYRSNGLTQKELQQALYIQASSLTKLIDTLEKKGLVTRIPHLEDARYKLISLTEVGSSLKNQLWIVKTEAEKEITKGLSKQEIEVLTQLLTRLKGDLLHY